MAMTMESLAVKIKQLDITSWEVEMCVMELVAKPALMSAKEQYDLQAVYKMEQETEFINLQMWDLTRRLIGDGVDIAPFDVPPV
jgi:hypothetical protein